MQKPIRLEERDPALEQFIANLFEIRDVSQDEGADDFRRQWQPRSTAFVAFGIALGLWAVIGSVLWMLLKG